MAAVHGKGSAVLFDENDLSSFFNQYNTSRQIQAVNTTTFGNDDKNYIAGVEGGTISVQGLFDGDTGAVDAVLDGSIASEAIITLCPQGYATIGNKAVMAKGEHVSYQIRSTTTDAVRITAGGTVDGGVRTGGVILQPLEAETTTTNNSSHDSSASSANGGVGHLHVTAFSGTNGVVKIQHSANDSTWADLITFSTVTGTTAERSLVTGTVNRYLRFAITTDNFTSMTVFASFARNRR